MPNAIEIIDSGEKNGAVWADVRLAPGAPRVLSPEAAAVLLAHYPTLAFHACKSSHGATTFGERIAGALLPHVVEHLAIDLLVRTHPGTQLAGNTRWQDAAHTVMRVRLKDVPADVASALPPTELLAAIAEATNIINSTVCKATDTSTVRNR